MKIVSTQERKNELTMRIDNFSPYKKKYETHLKQKRSFESDSEGKIKKE